jgi:hypothetical protein
MAVQAGDLFQIDVDIDLSSNPQVRDMFTRQELRAFFQANGIKIVSTSANGGGNATHIEVRGPNESLIKFVDTFLSEDAPGGVYTLLYKR